ncbi:MAG TPA: hypothetical protein VN253_29230 [Kofleriaceae bacterium]|nr:hypothetical protein [Kofleriaceae bacterium]
MRTLALGLVMLAIGCARKRPPDPDEEWGMAGALSPDPPPGQGDSEYRRGLLVSTDTSRTQVWAARNRWEDTDTAAAKAAGLAWPANSGLTWDAKYARWIESLPYAPTVDNYSTTFQLTTPWGKTLPAPSLECAELALFLRIAFAAWYELPLFFEAEDGRGRRVLFGHNGVRTAEGRYANTPEFALRYEDYTPAASAAAPWPKDPALRAKRVVGGEDDQSMIGAGAHLGAYLDEIHLNKRVGYFTLLALAYLGSVNLADPANAYNIVPEAVRAGDVLIERWQRVGIGHTLVVKQVEELPGGSKDVTTLASSMPRRQGVAESGQSSKSYFVSPYAGGEGAAAGGVPYAILGGGLKRFRVAKDIGGYWTNTWMVADEASWINSADYARLSARPARFAQILGQVSPEQQRTELLQQIADARHHLSLYPASCSARDRREQAFAALYELSGRAFGQSQAQVDAAYRSLEDYVFGALEYSRARTCCWNSSTAAMYAIVMDRARAVASSGGACVAPEVFKAQADGYARWQAYAASRGRAAEWQPWSQDEPCLQRSIPVDVEAPVAATPFCLLPGRAIIRRTR